MFKNRNRLHPFLLAALAVLALLALLLLLAITLVTPVRGAPLAQSDSSWRARYWNNKTLSGDPVLRRDEAEINHDWGDGSPEGVDDDNFSARWTRTINFPAGDYRFTATTDDGMRVWVDDRLIIDSWYDSQAHTIASTVNLSSGDHAVKVEYYEAGGQALAQLRIDTATSTDIRDWRGEYFNNSSLAGSPALVRNDPQIDFNWGGGAPAPGIGADNFSVRWTRSLDLPAGRYRWTTFTDDGVRLWVNGRLIIDAWYNQSGGQQIAETDIPGGRTDVRMEYYEDSGGAFAHLMREQLSGSGGHVDWRGEYFNNRNLSGSPAMVRNDRNIDFDWGNGSPASSINRDNFSVRWTRTMYLAPGRYRFEATTDDGVRLWINDRLIIDRWVDQRPTTSAGEINLPGGNVSMRMEYYEGVGGAMARLTRSQVNAAPTPTPAPPAAPTGTVPGARLNMREGPAASFAIVQVLAQGERVTVLGRNGAATWLLVQRSNGQQGWVYAPLLQINVPVTSIAVVRDSGVPQPTPPSGASQTATVSNAIFSLNVREGPGVDFAPITTINRGQVVQLLGRDGSSSWLYIVTPNNIYGWSSARYLDTNYPIGSLPVTG